MGMMRTSPKLALKSRHRHLLGYIKENRLRLLFAMVCMLLVAASTAATASLIKPILDEIFFNKNTRMLKLIPLAVIIIYVLRGLGMYGQEYLMESVGQRIIRRLRNDLYNRILDLPLAFFHSERTAS